MKILIDNPITGTYIFIAIFVFAILLSLRKKKSEGFFPISITNELKGVAILTVIFGHIGYFLVSDNRFLFPLSTISGVGVDLFLFLSGYGLVVSAIKKSRSVAKFYKDRLLKLLIPFWLILSTFFLLDFFVLSKGYSISYIMSSFLGFFPTADMYSDINSPLWYFTLILFYYFIFPLVFIKKRPWVSAILIYVISFLALNISFIGGVRYFYEIHSWAFPIGVLFGGLICSESGLILKKLATDTIAKINFHRWSKVFKSIASYLLIVIFGLVIVYGFYHSGAGKSININQLISIIVTLSFVGVFLLKKNEIKLFSLLGIYSYEIYLLHWPILYRYDVFFKFLPNWLAVSLYLILFIALGWLLKKVSERMSSVFLKEKNKIN
jgi:peptidoglycan/LPS O-acetylase OafA/YrhL